MWLLGWGVAWVQSSGRRIQRAAKLGVDRYVTAGVESSALAGHTRARPWPRRLPPRLPAGTMTAIVLNSFFWCSVAYHPALSWGSLPPPLDTVVLPELGTIPSTTVDIHNNVLFWPWI
jgi:hypothetical protein